MQSETLFWLIKYNLRTTKLIKSKLGMIRPWLLNYLNYRKFINRIVIVSMAAGQCNYMLQCLIFHKDRGEMRQAKIGKLKFKY